MGYIPPWIVHIYTHSKMKMFVVLALVAAAAAEPEADPALVYTTGLHGLHAPLTYAAGLPLAHHTYAGVPVVGVKSAVVESVIEKPADVKVETTPITYTVPAVHHPVVYNTAVPPVVAPVASHTITNYNNPEQYTAVSNGVSAPAMLPRTVPLSTSSSVRLKPIPLSCTLPTVTLPMPVSMVLVSMVLVSMVSTTPESTLLPPLSSLTPLSRPLTTLLPPPPSDTLTLPTSVSAPTLTVSRSPVNYQSSLHLTSRFLLS